MSIPRVIKAGRRGEYSGEIKNTSREVRLFALKGLEALPSSTRIALIYSLLYDSDTRVRAVARKELLTLPLETLKAYLEENPHPKVLDFLIRNIPKNSPTLPLLAAAPNLSHRTKSFLKSQGIIPQPKRESVSVDKAEKDANKKEEKPLEVDLEWQPDAEDFELPEGVEFSMPTEDDESELTVQGVAKRTENEVKVNLEDTSPAFEYQKQEVATPSIPPTKDQQTEQKPKIHSDTKQQTLSSQTEKPLNHIEAKKEVLPVPSRDMEEEEEAPEIGGTEEEADIEWKPVTPFKTTSPIAEELFPVREEQKTVPRQTIEKIQPVVPPIPLKVAKHKSYFLKGILIGSAISVILVLIFLLLSNFAGIFHRESTTNPPHITETQSERGTTDENTQNSTMGGHIKTRDILIGSYTSSAKAEQARQKAEALGLTVSVSQKTDEKTLWIVSSSNPEARGYCGSYSSEDDARKCALALKAAGYPASVSKVSKKTTTYTVKVKSIPEDKIEEILETLKSAGFKPRVI